MNHRDSVERWLIHEGLKFSEEKSDDNSFLIKINHAGENGVPIEIFEPKSQPGVLVVGSKVIMKNNQISRLLGFSKDEKEKFDKKVGEFCYSIQAIHKMITEDGKQKIGVYVVLDKPEKINQPGIFDAINQVSEMNEKTSRFLLKTF
jgi:hypothetical protein